MAEHMKVHALARLVFAGSINHIQVSWVKLGREASQLALLAGADDYGGTLFEENISRLAGSTAGQYTSTAEFQERIFELGRIPAQRNTLYTQYFDIAQTRPLPQRLKPDGFSTAFDAAEAVPLPCAAQLDGNA